jgi:hypothetical protein
LAPVPFLYPQGLFLYDLSNTGKDFMRTLYIVILIDHLFGQKKYHISPHRASLKWADLHTFLLGCCLPHSRDVIANGARAGLNQLMVPPGPG